MLFFAIANCNLKKKVSIEYFYSTYQTYFSEIQQYLFDEF